MSYTAIPASASGTVTTGTEVSITAASGQMLSHTGIAGNSGILSGIVKLMANPATASRAVGLQINGSTVLKYRQRYSTVAGGDGNDAGSSAAVLFAIEVSGTLEFEWTMDARVDGAVRLMRIREVQSDSASPTGHVWMEIFWANTSSELTQLTWVGGAADTFLQGSRSRYWQYL